MGLVIRDAGVVDGTGSAAYRADVTVAGDRIAAIGRAGRTRPGTRVIDGTGLVLAPGFIDMHAHSDLAVLTDPDHLAKVAQGVTLELLGQDGLSYAPIDDVTVPQLRNRLAGWNGDTATDDDIDWRTVADYLARLDRGMALNAAYLVPHGNVRMQVMGWNDGPPSAAELAAMQDLVAQGMRDGAVGLSMGLTYTPGMYAGTDELVALCATVASYDGFFAPHHRSYGADALDAYREMLDVSRRSGAPVHLSHATMNFDVNRGRGGELLALLDEALDRGVDVSLDSYPYLPGSTTLAALLPSWASEGGPDRLMRRLHDPGDRARIIHALDVDGSDGAHGVPVEWSAIQISGVRREANSALVGRHVSDLAAEAGRDPAELCLDVLIADDAGTTCLMYVGHEDNVRMIMRHRTHTGGSDGLLVGARPHPRAWGTFPRYLGHYVREEKVLTLEECVEHLTSRPARRLGLADRGVVSEGYVADLVLFDPLTVADAATFDEPRRPPVGIPYVVVNGELVIDGGQRTAALPGRAVRRADRHAVGRADLEGR
ncbi:MAG: putative N-acyl-D-amino-acid deacylase [Frankiales bacterium]|nr:putative N-acyl-D-amino-acid deacylase [Frankiales bacterium]